MKQCCNCGRKNTKRSKQVRQKCIICGQPQCQECRDLGDCGGLKKELGDIQKKIDQL